MSVYIRSSVKWQSDPQTFLVTSICFRRATDAKPPTLALSQTIVSCVELRISSVTSAAISSCFFLFDAYPSSRITREIAWCDVTRLTKAHRSVTAKVKSGSMFGFEPKGAAGKVA